MSSINSAQVTFEGIRNSIIETLSADPTFKDYNFTAPAISTLVDALAYVSHYHIRYSNFALNESFLDSAQLRHNVVSHAKELAYIPHQYTAAKAKIKVSVDPRKTEITSGDKVPEGTMFLATTGGGVSYIFRATGNFNFHEVSETEWSAEVDVIEGTWVEESFEQDEHYEKRFFLLNKNIDTDTLTVIVYANSTFTSGEEFIQVENIESFGPDYPVYYLQEAYNEHVELYFGDGILSKKLAPGNIIKVRYLVTNGGAANNIVSYSLMNNISDTILTGSVTVTTIEASNSGGGREDIESIRFNSPKFFQRQDRNVTTTDYNVAILHKFGGWIDSIVSWGGEDNIPPQYAKIFISVKPKYTDILSPSQKENIITYLDKKNLPCIEPVIVDPVYINVNMTLSIDWKHYNTPITLTNMTKKVEDKVKDFFKTNITTFKNSFKYSKFLTEISSVDSTLDSILTEIKLEQTLYPNTELESTYNFSFLNKIEPESVMIGPWKEDGSALESSIQDIGGNGTLYLLKGSYKGVIGSVDYETGDIKLNAYLFGEGSASQIPVIVSPVAQNINLAKNYLLKLTGLTVYLNQINDYRS